MPNPWGTAMQVLAGAFGGGASSLGQSRIDQGRIDEANRMTQTRDDRENQIQNMRFERENKRNAVQDKQWGREFGLQQEEVATRQAEVAARRAEAELRQTMLLQGRDAAVASLKAMGFPDDAILAVIDNHVPIGTYLSLDGRYAPPGARRPARETPGNRPPWLQPGGGIFTPTTPRVAPPSVSPDSSVNPSAAPMAVDSVAPPARARRSAGMRP